LFFDWVEGTLFGRKKGSYGRANLHYSWTAQAGDIGEKPKGGLEIRGIRAL